MQNVQNHRIYYFNMWEARGQAPGRAWQLLCLQSRSEGLSEGFQRRAQEFGFDFRGPLGIPWCPGIQFWVGSAEDVGPCKVFDLQNLKRLDKNLTKPCFPKGVRRI